MSVGTAIDVAVNLTGRVACAGLAVCGRGAGWVVKKTWKPTAKLAVATWLTVVALHFVCPRYLRLERETIDRLTPVSAQAAEVRKWEQIADDYAAAHHRNRCLVRAVIKVESKDCTDLVSKAGAMGCMQLMPGTAKHYGVKNDAERLDPEKNIYAGTNHLFDLVDRLGVYRGLQAYNAGEKRIDMTKENREYPHKVLKEWALCEDEVIGNKARG